MNEELEKKLEATGLSFGGVIGKAKRKFRDSKLVRTYSDEISKDEAKLFANDEYLAGLVLEQIRIDREITEHMDRVLEKYRSHPKSDLELTREKTMEEIEARTVKKDV